LCKHALNFAKLCGITKVIAILKEGRLLMLLREGEIRIPSGCAISGIINKKRKVFSGADIIKSIALMHDRSNGLGGGFAAYGIYPEYKELYAIHMFFDSKEAKVDVEQFLNEHFDIELSGRIPTRKIASITDAPIIWRYFVSPKKYKITESGLNEDEFMVRCVMKINSGIDGSFVASSGKNMGAFKAVGYPEDVGEFYMLDTYKAYTWTAHGRFPTNTPGWWGGAHPFTLLDWSVVHNGEISSYDANRRYLEMFGYKCSLQTDTEAITYIFDLLLRRNKLPLEVAVTAMAAPFWSEIDRMDKKKKELVKAVRTVYGSLLVNGPFSIILGSKNGFVALNDRIKLRSLVAATKDDFVYVASEESAIRVICENPDRLWALRGGEPVIALLEEEDSV
jgi:glutamate synthase domain-containing protein 1